MSGDVIEQGSAWSMGRWQKNSPALWSHRSDLYPIGKWTKTWAEPTRLVGEMVFAGTPKAQEARKLVEGGFLKSVSVGFVPGDHEPIMGKSGGWRFTSGHTLIECSLCNVGCQPDALFVGINGKSDEPEKTLDQRRLEAYETINRIRKEDAEWKESQGRVKRRLKMTPEQRQLDILSRVYSGDELEIRMQRWRDSRGAR